MCFAVIAEAYNHTKLMRMDVAVLDAYWPSLERVREVA